MNRWIGTGRLVKDPEVKVTKNGIAVCSFTFACDRKFKDENGEKKADFIPCVAWRKLAEIMGNNLHKGSKILIVGNIQTRNYDDKDGKKIFITELIVEEIEFLEKQAFKDNGKLEGTPTVSADNGFFPVDDGDSCGLPFDL